VTFNFEKKAKHTSYLWLT